VRSTFYQFCHTLTKQDDPVGDFANDFVAREIVAPHINSWDDLASYLELLNACPEAIEAGRQAWRRYELKRPHDGTEV